MNPRLSRLQAALLGLVVVLAAGAGAAGLVAVGAKQGVWADTFEVTAGFPSADDLTPGTPVRVRGVDAGQVVAVEYPATDAPNAVVLVRLRLDAKYRGRLYADATAKPQATGLLGGKVIAVSPGTPAAGPLAGDRIAALPATDPAEKLAAVADEAGKVLEQVRTGSGTLARLVRDDDLYHDIKSVVANADGAVKRGEQTLKKGDDTLQSIKQGTDAIQRMPLIRSYVEDTVALMVRPDCRREELNYNAADLFEPGSSILTDAGKAHLGRVVEVVRDIPAANADVVVAAKCEPTRPGPAELTKKQAEAVVAFVKAAGAHKMGWWTRRKITPAALGAGPDPAPGADALPPAYIRVLVFTPQP